MLLHTVAARVIALLVIYYLEPAWTREPREPENQDSLCQPFPSIVLERGETSRLANGSLVHDKLVYPAGSYQVVGNETRGCVCKLRPCLRKCCRRNEILGAGDRPNCTRLPSGWPEPDLVLGRAQLAMDIQGVSRVSELFTVVEGMGCSENASKYMLEPERYEEDMFVLERNGTLRTSLNQFPAWAYCLDWKESFEKIGVLVCVSADPAASNEDQERQQDSYKIGIAISIPFFLATFLVYAIIPELRNLYGKTLMCYVACLILAYTFLVIAKLFYFPFSVCSTIGEVFHDSYDSASLCSSWYSVGVGEVRQRELSS